MSGIMAIVSLDGRPVPVELAKAQLSAITHRGEWEPRLWEAPGIALGHVNLPRTPEAEREVLPASDSSQRYWITWDGRLDNRAELAGLLRLDAERARQMTDADYVLAAYARWACDCVNHLVGDWAVLIWDSVQRTLFCAKDPLGWRQLYYVQQQGLLFVGSEPQQLFAGGQVPAVVNNGYLLRFLAGALQEPGSTNWEGLIELAGGEHLLIQNGRQRKTTYWNGPEQKVRFRRPEEYVDQFEHLVAQATNAHMRSNTKVGTFLSGGLDSSYVTSIASRFGAQKAYTLFVPGSQNLDERSYARLVATRMGIELSEIDTTNCWFLSSTWLPAQAFDQPNVPGAAASILAVVTAAKDDGIGVMLGGEGGDEWLSGGGWQRRAHRIVTEALVNRRFRTGMRIQQSEFPERLLLIEIAVSLAKTLLPPDLLSNIARVRGRNTAQFPAYVGAKSDWIDEGSATQLPIWQPQAHTQAMLRLYRNAAGPEVAWRDRWAFLGNSVELRCPLNDSRVVNFLLGTPDWVKRFRGLPRDILRDALRREGLNEVAARLDKGHYEEQLRMGLADKEKNRLRNAVACLQNVGELDGAGLESEVVYWLQRQHRWNRPIYRIATAGLWKSQVNDVRARSALASRSFSEREEVISNEETILSTAT